MTLDVAKSIEIIPVLEKYLEKVRPPLEIRPKLDLGYEIKGQSVLLHEIRPLWNNPEKIMTYDYAKATFVKSQNIWKIYWLRGNLKWHLYSPKPTVKTLTEFLNLVEKDKHHCFKG